MADFKVLLLTPPNYLLKSDVSSFKKIFSPSPPFGLLSIAAVLLEDNVDVEFVDTGAEDLDVEGAIERIRHIKDDVIGIPIMTPNASVTEALLRRIREEYKDSKIVLGHKHAEAFSDYYLNNDLCDIVGHGEAEYIMRDLCDALAEDKSLTDVKGISYMTDAGIVNTEKAPRPEDLNKLPLPARHIAPMHLYSQHVVHSGNLKCFHVISSRGCPVGCDFCCIHDGKTVRARSPENVIEEIRILVEEYGANEINFYDPMFLANSQRLFAICDGIRENFPGLKWRCEAHINFLNDRVLEKLSQSGCHLMYYGIESGEDKLLQSIGKHTTVEKVTERILMTRRFGIKVHGFFLLGIPGETPEMSEKTIQLALNLPLESAMFSLYTPFPGSDIFEVFSKEKRIDPYDWDKFNSYSGYSNLDPVYVPDGRTADEMKKLQRRAIRLFTLRPKNIFRQLLKINRHNIKQSFNAFKVVVFPQSKSSKNDHISAYSGVDHMPWN